MWDGEEKSVGVTRDPPWVISHGADTRTDQVRSTSTRSAGSLEAIDGLALSSQMREVRTSLAKAQTLTDAKQREEETNRLLGELDKLTEEVLSAAVGSGVAEDLPQVVTEESTTEPHEAQEVHPDVCAEQ